MRSWHTPSLLALSQLLGSGSLSPQEAARPADPGVRRQPDFGQTHQHTGWSFDEASYNVRLGPENSYRHARGERVEHPSSQELQLKLPLDFMRVSDHSEDLGVPPAGFPATLQERAWTSPLWYTSE